MDENRQHSSTPIFPEYPALTNVAKGPQSDVLDFKPAQIDPPPSIYHLVNGKTYFSNEFGIKDSSKSELVNDFILAKTKEQGLQNNKDGYRQALKEVLKEIGLTNKHDGNLVVEQIYERFLNKTMNARDYLLFLNIITNGR